MCSLFVLHAKVYSSDVHKQSKTSFFSRMCHILRNICDIWKISKRREKQKTLDTQANDHEILNCLYQSSLNGSSTVIGPEDLRLKKQT